MQPIKNRPAFDRVTAARIQVLQTSPFYGLAAMRFDLIEDPDHPDMWTDGQQLGYSPKWATECSFDLLKSTIAHCAHHVALCHHLRRESRDEKLWNQSTDRVVNAAMKEAGFVLPKGVKTEKGDGEKSAEEIYTILAGEKRNQSPSLQQKPGKDQKPGDNQDQSDSDQPGNKGNGNSKGDGDGDSKPGKGNGESNSDQPGECKDAKNPDGSSLSQSQLEEKIQEQLQDTAALAQQAKGIGELPGSIARQVQALLYPQQDWAEQLREFMLSLSNTDYSWSRPNRRFVHQGLYLPSLLDEGKMGKIVIAIDTSGSISISKLDRFLSELNGILEQCKPESVTIIHCDYRISRVDEYSESDYPVDFGEITGGGGTSLIPPFDYVEENGLSPDCLIYFTDLAGPQPHVEPPYPVCWLDQDNYCARYEETYYRPKFGKLIGIPGPY